nr:MAG TPA: hypothetical protein [Caudoviricetes sp.]
MSFVYLSTRASSIAPLKRQSPYPSRFRLGFLRVLEYSGIFLFLYSSSKIPSLFCSSLTFLLSSGMILIACHVSSDTMLGALILIPQATKFLIVL